MSAPAGQAAEVRLWSTARGLAVFTILYNLVEGLVSAAFGVSDESLTLLGFGFDSFVEVISGVGILAMVNRIAADPEKPRSAFESAALRVTGSAFYLLTGGLVLTAVYNVISGHRPQTTVPGVIISLVSIAVMWWLVREKRRTGHALACSPILADAQCTLVCVYMSVILLASSLLFSVSGIGYVDSLGALGLAYFSFTEGREAFEKANDLAGPAPETSG